SGTVVPAQNINSGSSITVYSISRDAGGNFVANVAADSWSYASNTGGVVAGDLVPAGNKKSAVFTGHAAGTAAIHAAVGALSADSGTLTVVGGATASKLAFTTQPANAAAGSVFGTQPVIKTQDTFGNNSTVGLAASSNVTVALTAGTGPLQGTVTLNIGTGAGNGTVTYTNLRI